MVFSSPVFVFAFLPCLLLVYFCVGKRLRNGVLLLFSLFFYAWGEPKNILIMLLSIGVNYGLGLGISRTEKKKWLLILALVFDLGMLFLFKYLNFAVEIWNGLGILPVRTAQIALPIGISFYTFQIMSYVIDVYRGKCEAQRNLLHLSLYVSLFPQLIAGPIVRYVDVAAQIEDRETRREDFVQGALRFARGFSKKILIADQLSVLADTVFAGNCPSLPLHWMGMIAYSLQIYYDFSGYSDMAIGLGKMFGFDFLENFRFPYAAASVQDFWRRWHISLSGWFRDYLYIPLGGNRKGQGRTYLHLLIVFFLTGLWHGASFNFIVWGLYYAFFLIMERAFLGAKLKKAPGWLRHLYTLLVVMIGWVFFRAENLPAAVSFLRGLVIPAGKDWAYFQFVMDRQFWVCLLAGAVLSVPWRGEGKALQSRSRTVAGDFLTICLFVVAICYMMGSGFSPFLYFRF